MIQNIIANIIAAILVLFIFFIVSIGMLRVFNVDASLESVAITIISTYITSLLITALTSGMSK